MFDFGAVQSPVDTEAFHSEVRSRWSNVAFVASKRAIDAVVSIALLPVLIVTILGLTLLNPFYNRGPLFFVQRRMGRNCAPFNAIKFRTMTVSKTPTRTAECPLEVDRITRLGRFLRKSRIDELPQILNVLLGDMSLIGPRPDIYDHAMYYMNSVPGYRKRYIVRPGISGLAQTEVGYVTGSEGTRRKVKADLYYVANAGLKMELWLIWRTLSVVLRRQGS